ncbi:MAG: LON peptidase substrate-binding domain-containing protein [Phycisphaeraceae bacterium]|nr:LON peptidase substrate-binding domain-containing protein [Phycisphaeraceae bacterium]MCW5755540.1 LON peptidase substrate-binding domain-containing protein [Phycisphaeraceae bacterium]
MTDGATITVNFAKPMPVFPLDTAVLLPQQVLPLHIFEPRYRQMIDHVLDGAGQFAMGVFAGDRWKQEYHGRPPLRPFVCIGQVVQHERLDDGRYNVLVQGVCRARIIRELPPSAERHYREAMLSPVGLGDHDDDELSNTRARLGELLAEGPLTHLAAAPAVSEYIRNTDVPTAAILELVSFTLLNDPEVRYRLLAEPSTTRRAEIIEHELGGLIRLLTLAERQRLTEWPKGMSWN